MSEFQRIAIVNRGEPAMRLIHAARELSHESGAHLRTLALYTEPDSRSLFVREADEAFALGSATFADPRGERKSRYLDYETLERALLATRAEAVWAGWGFVAERADFVDLCRRLGVVFIGPDADVMRRLGDKITAKKLAEEADVPVAAWSGGAVDTVDEARDAAARLGYPLLIKATAGGGGRGIRKVRSDDELAAAFERARGEARQFFGDPAVFLESLVDGAHHVEVQIVADAHGAVWALGVRDCTLQRRNQKILEETPSPVLSAAQDHELRGAAERLARRAGYTNAGTVEFLYSPAERRFAFMEVNARLQVEHPVTELATGVDLVKLQIHVARGGRLDGEPPAAQGHAIEVRLNAEDPENGFAPAPGRLELFRPASGPGLRIDTGVEEGDEIAPEFDSMIAKIIAHGRDRGEALARLRRGLQQTGVVVRGGTTNKSFLQVLLERPELASGDIDVAWLDRLAAEATPMATRHAEVAMVAAAIDAYETASARARARFLVTAAHGRPETENSVGRAVELSYRGHSYPLRVFRLSVRHFQVDVGAGRRVDVRTEALGPYTRRLTLGGTVHRVFSVVQGGNHLIEVDGVPHRVSEDQGGLVRSPSPAVVVAITVKEGDEVAAGDRLAVIEAMKMETAVVAETSGRVRKIFVKSNVQVAAGAPLLEMEPAASGSSARAAEQLALADLAERCRDRGGAAASHVDDLRRLMLGYDIDAVAIQRLVAAHGESCRDAGAHLPERLESEEQVLAIFMDVCSLAGRLPSEGDGGLRRSREDYFFHYLRDLSTEGKGLPESFLDNLRRALGHYGVTSLERTPELEESLFRLYKSHQEMAARLAPVLSILEQRLEDIDRLAPATGAGFRELLERMIAEARARFPAVHDLAREVHYRYFDRPFLEKVRERAFAEVEESLRCLEAAVDDDAECRPYVDALVACPQPIKGLVSRRYEAASQSMQRLLLEIITRRYYQIRPLENFATRVVDGRGFALASYVWQGKSYDLLATHALYGDLAAAAAACDPLLASLPDGREKVLDFYLWRPGSRDDDATSQEILAAIEPLLARHSPERVAVALSSPGSGRVMQHFAYREGAEGWAEDRKLRHLHPMMCKRLEIDRLLTHFDLERLASVDDIYLFYASAQSDGQDERLIAFAEVRDLTPVRDAAGTLVKLPEFERIFMECLTGIGRYQAHRPPGRRLHWNRVNLYVWPPSDLRLSELREMLRKLTPAAEGLGLEKIKVHAQLAKRRGRQRQIVLAISNPGRGGVVTVQRRPVVLPLEPFDEYTRKVVRLRQRGLVHPYELIRMLAPSGARSEANLPPGEFTEHDLDAAQRLVPVARPPGRNRANLVVGVIRNFTEKYPEGMARVILLSDPSHGMGSLAEPECRRIVAALDLAQELGVPVEWFAVSAGARISMESGTENMDWIARALRRLVTFTQAGGEVNVIVNGVNVGAQPYWNAEATMLMHTRGILIMTADGAMVLTGKQALDFSGGVSAEDNRGIGGYERIMGPNGQAQYFARDTAEACHVLLRYYECSYVAPGERFPRRAPTEDPRERDVCVYSHGGEFARVGDVFSEETNPGRKKPFDVRQVMAAVVDQDYQPLERWYGMQGGGEGAVVWDAHLGGYPVSLLGIESRPLTRLGFVPADGPDQWSAGTLFPRSAKKIARAINAASGSRPVVMLANLSGFDGSPESMRTWQLEYGAEIGRAVVNFRGPIVFCVISRYHGGAFVVFSNALHDNMEVAALEGSHASVIGGAPAAAVVFAREVASRTRSDPRIRELEELIAAADGAEKAKLRGHYEELWASVHSEKLGEMSEEFDGVHSVERAKRVGSVHRIIPPQRLRPYLIAAVERGMKKELEKVETPGRSVAWG